MKGTATVVFDRERLNNNLVDVAHHLTAVVELISAASALFDEEEYDLPSGGSYLLGVIERDAVAALRAFRDMRVQITGVDPADVDADAAVAELTRPA